MPFKYILRVCGWLIIIIIKQLKECENIVKLVIVRYWNNNLNPHQLTINFCSICRWNLNELGRMRFVFLVLLNRFHL